MPTTKHLSEIQINKAYRCPKVRMLALDGWTWNEGDDDTSFARECSLWHSGDCNACARKLGEVDEQLNG